MTATGPDERPPSWAGRGKQVDVAAPGADVYRAIITDDGREVVGPGDGTSFSCAAVAGIAALWVAFHTPKRFEKAFTKKGIALAFKKLLRETARSPESGWDRVHYGAGIVDAKALLERGLGKDLPARALRDFTASTPGEDEGGVEAFFEMFDEAPRDGVRTALKESLNADDDAQI